MAPPVLQGLDASYIGSRRSRYDARMSTPLTDLELLRRLIAFDSVSASGTAEIAAFLVEYLDSAGVHVETVTTVVDGVDQVNLIAWRGRLGPSRDGLVLSGHLDVVPAPAEEWSTPPFTLTEIDDRLHGRGTSDMKGFVAIAANVLRGLGDTPVMPLMVMLSAQEEVGALGARELVEHWPLPEPPPIACLVGEPTELTVVAMHKGHTKVRIHVHGQSAHSGTPDDGDNAIDRAGRCLVGLGELREALRRERSAYGDAGGAVPFPALNIGRIAGGTAINVVPDHCTIELGIRALPGQASADLIARVRATIAAMDDGDRCEIEIINDTPALDPTPEAPFVSMLYELRGQSALTGVSYASDGSVFQKGFDMTCALCGPGSMSRAHKPDEYITLQELRDGRDVVTTLLERWQGMSP